LEVFDFDIQKLILNVVCRDISFAKCQLIQHFKVLKIQSQYWILLNVSLSKAAAEDPSTFMLIEIAYLLNFSQAQKTFGLGQMKNKKSYDRAHEKTKKAQR
jgi:hypothetical protein